MVEKMRKRVGIRMRLAQQCGTPARPNSAVVFGDRHSQHNNTTQHNVNYTTKAFTTHTYALFKLFSI
jgi:hypothetical protein